MEVQREGRDYSFVVFPSSVEQVSAIMRRVVSECKVPVTPQGGNTGLVGGSVPLSAQELILNFSKMNKVSCLPWRMLYCIDDMGWYSFSRALCCWNLCIHCTQCCSNKNRHRCILHFCSGSWRGCGVRCRELWIWLHPTGTGVSRQPLRAMLVCFLQTFHVLSSSEIFKFKIIPVSGSSLGPVEIFYWICWTHCVHCRYSFGSCC